MSPEVTKSSLASGGDIWKEKKQGDCAMIRLEKRPEPSRNWALATPVLAVLATMVAGGLMFMLLGNDPVEAIRTIFWDPLFNDQFAAYSRPQLLVKAGPLILIAIGLVPRVSRRGLEHRRRGPVYHRRALRRGRRAGLLSAGGLLDLPAHGDCRCPRRLGLGDDPGRSPDPVQHQRDPRLAASRLCCRTVDGVDVGGALAQSRRLGLSRQPEPSAICLCREQRTDRGHRHALGRRRGLHRGDLCLYPAEPSHHGLQHPPCRTGPPRRQVLGRQARPPDPVLPWRLGRACRACGTVRGRGTRRPDLDRFQRGLRLYRDHRGLSRASAPGGHPPWRGFSWR